MLKKICYFFGACLLAVGPFVSAEAAGSSNITSLRGEQLESFIQSAQKPVILDIYAPWCGACMQMMPIYEQLAAEYGNKYHFVSVNVDEDQQVVQKYGVTGMPTFKVFKNGMVVGSFIGYTSKEEFLRNVENAVRR